MMTRDRIAKEMAVFIGDLNKAKAHTVGSFFIINTIEIRPNHLACKLNILVIWRFDENLISFI